LKQIQAFSPGHITGFFQICDEPKDPLLKGSRGAGVSVSQGVITAVKVSKTAKQRIKIRINGSLTASAPVSKNVVAKLLSYTEDKNYRIEIDHIVGLPVGCGFGTSGAAALSLSFAMNEVLDLGFSRTKAAQIAHIAEVECQTGLGTVIAETSGGIEIRTKPGGPGKGEVITISNNSAYSVVCLPIGPIPTPKLLSDKVSRTRINELGGLLTDALLEHPTVDNFLGYSRKFAEHIQLFTERTRRVIQDTDDLGVKCSTAIFGENVFTLVPNELVKKVKEIFASHASISYDVLVMDVDCKGARLLDE
jgi:pantoate kinase